MTQLLKTISHGFGSKLFLLLSDVLGLLLIFNLVHFLRIGSTIRFTSGPIWAIVLIVVVTLYVMDVYRTETPITRARLPLQTFLAVPVAAVLTALFVYALGVESFLSIFGRGVMPIAFFLFSLWAASFRWLLTFIHERYGDKLCWYLLMEQPLAAQLQDDLDDKRAGVSRYVDITDLPAALPSFPVDLDIKKNGIIVSDMSLLDDALVRRISDFRFRGMRVLSYSAFYERYWSRIPVRQLSKTWFLQASGFDRIYDHVGLRFQRVVDVLVSLIGMLVFSPVLLLVAILIRLTSPGAAIYKQQRVGLNGGLFTLYKFRSMVADAERDGPIWASKDDPRVTRFGKFLRTSRLDELPQLLNIFKGQMSFIGPRPERPEFVAELRDSIPHYDLRHLVAPGLTGWAQVMYSYASSVDEAARKLEYDLYYIKNHSIQLDFAILIKTVFLVLRRMGQ
jgi:exopolysaccharide biosynthesis polyprenyl glycosylphosphotransferase